MTLKHVSRNLIVKFKTPWA